MTRQVYLVSGASTGFGALTVRALALRGHTVFAGMYTHDGNTTPHEQALASFAASHGVDLRPVALDLLSQSSVDAAVQHVVDATAGRIDAVVHNAGHMCYGPTEAFAADQFLRLLDVGVVGSHRLNAAVLPHMRRARAGHVVWVGSSSTYGMKSPYLGPYFAAKAAQDSLAQSLAHELAPWGIETTVVLPGVYGSGTNHFADAAQPGRSEVNREYQEGPTKGLAEAVIKGTLSAQHGFPPLDQDVSVVAEAIAELSVVPRGKRPFRLFPDEQMDGTKVGALTMDLNKENAYRRFGLAEYLQAWV